MDRSSALKDLDEVVNKKIEIYSYKFPNNSIYVGYTTRGLDFHHNKIHKKSNLSPIFKILKEYPNVKPKNELNVENKSYRELYKIRRQIFDANPDMKILNVNLWLYGY